MKLICGVSLYFVVFPGELKWDEINCAEKLLVSDQDKKCYLTQSGYMNFFQILFQLKVHEIEKANL